MKNDLPHCWIETIDPKDAGAELKEIYEQLDSCYHKIHNLYRAFSLQPKPLPAADQCFRHIMHNEANHSEPWFLELLATQVAMIADCVYALTHHGANFKKLLADEILANRMLEAVRSNDFSDASIFSPKQSALLFFGAKLTSKPEAMTSSDIEALRKADVSDTEILEAVQTTANFAYWVRFINALGINLSNEKIGIY